MDRIKTICSYLPECEIFADVGCDHGYVANEMLKNSRCIRVYISDISAGSLKKAETLLAKEIEAGRCVPVLADGMKGLPHSCDCVLIAGLGGEEIVRILEEGFFPPRLVLQPMKNSERVRAFLMKSGYRITKDITFCEGAYYYDIITAECGASEEYTEWELKFGRDNLKELPQAFLKKIKEEEAKLRGYLSRPAMKEESRSSILKRLYELEVITNATDEDL